jgi:hypothetical protein
MSSGSATGPPCGPTWIGARITWAKAARLIERLPLPIGRRRTRPFAIIRYGGGQMIKCPECLGVGRVEDEYEVGGYTPDRWMEVRVQEVECPRCGGWGEVEE